MNRGTLIGLSTATALALALLPGVAVSQEAAAACMIVGQKPPPSSMVQAVESLKEQLVGAWTLVSYERVFPDGRRLQLMGADPKGIIIFDPTCHFAQIHARSDLPATDRAKATPEEATAIVEGIGASYGRFTVNAYGNRRVMLIYDLPTRRGQVDPITTMLSIDSLTPDELDYHFGEMIYQFGKPSGEEIHLAYKRAK